MFKKMISPILYAAFLVPVLIGTIAVIASIESTIGLSRFILVGAPEAFISIIIIGSLLFWLANKLMTGLEKLLKPSSLDHFRQSSLYYLTSLYALTSLVRHGYYGGLGEAYMLIALVISVWAIIVNATFLYKRRKANIS
jgi:hypothetical protein